MGDANHTDMGINEISGGFDGWLGFQYHQDSLIWSAEAVGVVLCDLKMRVWQKFIPMMFRSIKPDSKENTHGVWSISLIRRLQRQFHGLQLPHPLP